MSDTPSSDTGHAEMARMAAALAGMRRVHRLHGMLARETDLDAALAEILATACELIHTDRGCMQLVSGDGTRLDMTVWHGYASDGPFVSMFRSRELKQGDPAEQDRRLIEDWSTQSGLDPAYRAMLDAEGIAASQSTPIVGRDGDTLGVLSTQFHHPYRPDDDELRLIDFLVRMAADFIERFRGEQVLHESEERMRLANQAGDVGIWELDLKTGKSPIRSPRRDRIFGYDKPRADWSYEVFFDHVHPDDREQVKQACEEAAQTGKWAFESRIIRADGETHWIAVEGTFYFDKDGQPAHAVGIITDITRRRRSEATLRESDRRKTFILKLRDALRPLTDTAAIQSEACRLLGEALGVDRAYYVEVDEDRNEAHVSQNYLRGDSPSLQGTHRASDFGWVLEAMRGGEVVIINDAQQDEAISDAERPAMAAVQIAAHINAPLLKDGRLVGALCATESVPRQWTDGDIELLRETAERIWATIERARTETALRISEARYRTMFRTMDEGYLLADVIFDADDRAVDIAYVEANPAATRIVGVDLTGRRLREVSSRYEDYWYEIWGQVARTGKSRRLQRYASPEGLWYDFYIFKVEPDNPESRRVAVFFQDTTTRTRSEQAQRVSEERQAFLLKLSDALRDEADPDAVGMIATRMLAGHMGVDRSYVCRLSRQQALAWIDHEYCAPGLVSAAGAYHFDDFPESLRGSHEESMAIDDLRNDARLSEHDKQTIETMGMQAVLTGILRKSEQDRVWALVVGDSRPRVWSKADRVLVEETTERTWTAMKRARAEYAMRESEVRYRSVVDSAADGIWIADQEHGRLAEVNPAACRILGYSHHEYMQLTVRDLIRPKDEARLRGLMDMLARGESVTEIWKIRHADGHYVPLELNHTYTPNGFWQGIGRDVSERRRVERELKQRSDQFVALLRESPMGVYLVDPDFRIRVINPAARQTAGVVENFEGHDFERAMHASWSREYADELVRRVRRTLATGKPYFAGERAAKRDNDTTWYAWHIHRTAIPGNGEGVVCYLSDVTHQVRARERQKLLLMEVNHRVKNTLATVQSIATQSLRNASTLEEGGAVLESRLISLSKAHDVLTREHWEGGDLSEVVANTLSAYPDRAGASRFRISGDDIRLKPKAVVSLSMALHELATNAVKYGALSGEDGYVEIAWETDGEASDHCFRMRWSEHDGPPVHAPERRGFGSRLIEQGLAMDMNGDVHLDFDPEGLVCTIDAPLDGIRSGK